MARKPFMPAMGNAQPDSGKSLFPKHMADDAYAAHAAMVLAEQANPALALNPYWKPLRDSAFARFRAALEASDAA